MAPSPQPRITPAKRIAVVPVGAKAHLYTLRDDNNQHYHRAVALKDTPYFVELAWRAARNAPVHTLGTFRLDLPALLKAGYIRSESSRVADEVRVRFFRAGDGWIYLQSTLNAPALRVIEAPI